MGLKNRIKAIILDHCGGSNKQFSEKLGVGLSTINTWDDQHIPKGDILQRIHGEFRVNINWLLTGEGNQYVNLESEPEGATLSSLATDSAQASLFTKAIEMLTGALVSNQTLIKELTSRLAEMSTSPDKRSDTIDQLVEKCADLEEEVKALKDLLLESQEVHKVAENQSP